ncbi:MAG: hypothetical protein RL417_997 [Pseudomonadota bacterium]|jgi:hypothetical protein
MKTTRSLLLLALLGTVGGCADLGDPYYNPPPSYGYGGGYDPYYRDDYYADRERERLRRERREVERERDRLESERDRLEREREQYNRPPPPPPPKEERCPRGFSPSERKCTPEERKRGCQDMRLPGGLGCVKR